MHWYILVKTPYGELAQVETNISDLLAEMSYYASFGCEMDIWQR